MDAKPAPRVWYADLNERLMELGKEDPEVYKHWHDWYEPKAEQPLWLKPDSLKVLRSSWKRSIRPSKKEDGPTSR